MKQLAVVAVAILLVVLHSDTSTCTGWTYDNQKAWPYLEGSSCGGRRQSPVNIKTEKVKEVDSLTTLVFNSGWDEQVDGSLDNTGHSVQFTPSASTVCAKTTNHIGAYDLQQFHFHWGAKNNKGSEHRVNFQPYGAEIHFVHTKYNTTDKTAGDYYSVVAVFCEVTGAEATGVWATLLDNLPTEFHAKNNVSAITFSDLLPKVRDYYYYMGSLTTPLCDETVQWFVLKEPIPIPRSVLKAFRAVQSDEQGVALRKNFRKTQRLFGRSVFSPLHY